MVGKNPKSLGLSVLLVIVLLTWTVTNTNVVFAEKVEEKDKEEKIVEEKDKAKDKIKKKKTDKKKEKIHKEKKEKIEKKTTLDEKLQALEDLKALAELEAMKDDPDFKKKFKELEKEIKEILKDLKKNYGYDKELKKEIKKEITLTKIKKLMEMAKHEKNTRQKIDSKIAELSKSSDPESYAKKMGFEFKNGKTKIVIKLTDIEHKVLEKLETLGTITAKNDNHIQLVSDLGNIQKIRLLDGVEKIRPPFAGVQMEQQIIEDDHLTSFDLVQYVDFTGKKLREVFTIFSNTFSQISK